MADIEEVKTEELEKAENIRHVWDEVLIYQLWQHFCDPERFGYISVKQYLILKS